MRAIAKVEFQVASRLSARRGAPVPLIPVRSTWLRLSSRDSRPVRASALYRVCNPTDSRVIRTCAAPYSGGLLFGAWGACSRGDDLCIRPPFPLARPAHFFFTASAALLAVAF